MFSPELYLPVYHHGMLIVTLITAGVYAKGDAGHETTVSFNSGMLLLGTFSIVIFLGTRPVSGAFVDMLVYAASYTRAATYDVSVYPDPGFDIFLRLCANSVPVEAFFLICAGLYVAPLAIGMRKAHAEWAFPAFLAFVTAFSFFAYGTNGIRNGIATSLMVCAFAYRTNLVCMTALMALALSMHKSVAIPILAFLLTRYVASVTLYAAIWFFTFLAVSVRGQAITAFFSQFTAGTEDDRLANYVSNAGFGNDRGGYRLDFILYSIVPVAIAYFLADTRTRGDALYKRLTCAYLATNTVWLLLMHAAFSNRFAYLSWCFMPWLIIYPFIYAGQSGHGIRQLALRPRYPFVGAALIAHFAFTYAMNVLILPNRGG